MSSTETQLPAGGDYRAYLDGVRALAVGLVIVFHLGYSWLPGGFVGVDVFFVLSGYLITGVLLREVTGKGKVRMTWFYSRRIRRLLAASALVIGVVIVFAHLLLDAIDKQSVGHDAMSAALYVANWHFASGGAEYFAPGDVPSPLIHFWSLAVEEQFYVVWPTSFYLLWRWSTGRRGDRRDRSATGKLLVAILVLLVVSAVLSIVLAGTTTTYYGTHTRAYQLLAGAALAVIAARMRSRDHMPDTRTIRALGLGGGVLAFAGLIWLGTQITDASNYPGWWGIAVTAGAAALIAALELTPEGPLHRTLGSQVPATIGRMSYSLYLWHWPVIVFAPLIVDRYGFQLLSRRGGQLLVIFAASAFSYYVVERPVRFKLFKPAAAYKVVVTGLAVSAVVAVAASWALSPRGHFAGEALAANKDIAASGDCPYTPEQWNTKPTEPCVWHKGGKFVVALVGDSHAMQWEPALDKLARERDFTIIRVTRGGCPANTIKNTFLDERGTEHRYECSKWRREINRKLIKEYDPDLIYIETRSQVWPIRSGGHNVKPRSPEHLKLWSQGWDPTLRALTAGSGKVVVSAITPTMPFDVPACLIKTQSPAKCNATLQPGRLENPYNKIIKGLSKRFPGVATVDPTPIICPGGRCPAMIDGKIVHRDTNHISGSFSIHVAEKWAAMLARAGAKLP